MIKASRINVNGTRKMRMRHSQLSRDNFRDLRQGRSDVSDHINCKGRKS